MNCNCMHECFGECPETINCPLDKIVNCTVKNLSVKRKRHHKMLETQKKAEEINSFTLARYDVKRKKRRRRNKRRNKMKQKRELRATNK